ncbi:MAG: cysteine desulfurase [Clostridiales bacterium]|nr:cysteine desulfurase [Clostridiales bacterium]
MDRVYLDHAATTPLRPEAREAMLAAWDQSVGNPSSVHREGQKAKKLLEEARDNIAASLCCLPEEVFFTSGGTESNNWALRSLAALRMKDTLCHSETTFYSESETLTGTDKLSSLRRHIIVSEIEHPSILRTAEAMEREGVRVTRLSVDRYGLVSSESLQHAITEDTVLVSVMLANNEIGTIEPIRELSDIAHQQGALFHTDAVQAVGSIPVSIKDLGVDALSFSGHKFGGPTGIGGLYVSQSIDKRFNQSSNGMSGKGNTGRFRSLIFGGEQERGHRAGTENLAGVLGMAKALEMAVSDLAFDGKAPSGIERLRDRLIASVLDMIPEAHLCGHPGKRLPGNAHFVFDGVDGEALLLYLNVERFACSSGSACTSGSNETSHVLKAIGLSEREARSALRISIGRENTEEEVLSIVPVLQKLVQRLRK